MRKFDRHSAHGLGFSHRIDELLFLLHLGFFGRDLLRAESGRNTGGALRQQLLFQAIRDLLDAFLLHLPYFFPREDRAAQIRLIRVAAGPRNDGRQPFALRQHIAAGKLHLACERHITLLTPVNYSLDKNAVIGMKLDVMRCISGQRLAQVDIPDADFGGLAVFHPHGGNFRIVQINRFRDVSGGKNQVSNRHFFRQPIRSRLMNIAVNTDRFFKNLFPNGMNDQAIQIL